MGPKPKDIVAVVFDNKIVVTDANVVLKKLQENRKWRVVTRSQAEFRLQIALDRDETRLADWWKNILRQSNTQLEYMLDDLWKKFESVRQPESITNSDTEKTPIVIEKFNNGGVTI